MNVLQATLDIVGRTDPQPLLHPGIPRLRQVAHGELAAQQLLLQLVAQHDVQRIRELVGVDANEAAPHPGEMPIDAVDVPLRSAHTEMLRQQRLHVAHERPAAAHDHFDEQRLALLESHAAVAADRLILPILRQPEVVHRMARLVQRAEQARKDVIRVEARGHADVPGHAFGERMLAFVQTAAVEGKADRLHDLHDQRALLARREFAGERQERPAVLHGDRLANERGQAAGERLEHRIDVRGGQARAELVDQRVIGREVQRLPQQRGLVAHQMHHFLEVRHRAGGHLEHEAVLAGDVVGLAKGHLVRARTVNRLLHDLG